MGNPDKKKTEPLSKDEFISVLKKVSKKKITKTKKSTKLKS